MTREEHLAYCKICTKRKTDFKVGLVCSLTDELADFENACENFELDSEKKEESENSKKKESKKEYSFGISWFLIIFGATVFNSLIQLFGEDFFVGFGLGLAYLYGYAYTGKRLITDPPISPSDVETNFQILAACILIASIYLIIWFYARRRSKLAYLIGIIIYISDALIVLVLHKWWGAAFHALVLIELYARYSITFKKPDKQNSSNNE